MRRGRFPAAALMAVLVPLCCPPKVAAAAPSEDRPGLLVLHSYHTEMPWARTFQQGLEGAVGPEDEREIRLFIEWGDLVRFGDEGTRRVYREYLDSKYRDAGIRVVVADGPHAAEFMARGGRDLFPGSSLFVIGSRPVDFSGDHSFEGVTWVPTVLPFSHTFDLIRTLRPSTRHIEVVADGTEANRRRLKEVAEAFDSYAHQLTVHYFTDFTEKELLEHVATLPPESAIFYLPVFRDSAGRTFLPGRLLKRLSDRAAVPVFSSWGTFLGQGIVGGKLIRGELTGGLVAELAQEALKGERVERSPKELAAAQVGYFFDHRELRRWKIPERRLPEGSTLFFRHPSLFEEYRRETVSAALFFAALTALIAVLLKVLQVRARALAEKTAAEKELKALGEKLADLAAARGRQLEENRALLLETQKVAQLGNWKWEFETGKVSWSEELYRLFGATPQTFDPSTRDFIRAVHPDDRNRVLTGIRTAAASGIPYDEEHRIVHPDGAVRSLRVRGRTERNGDGRRVRMLGFAYDITDYRETEENRRSLAALREREMISSWLHDNLGADLYNITLLTDTAREKTLEPDLILRQLDCVAEISRSALANIRSYLDFSSQVGTSFSDLLRHMERYGHRLLTPLGIDFSFTCQLKAEPPSLTGLQSFNLYLIFKEALTNVIRHAGASSVVVTVSALNGTLNLSVRDNGRGISAARQADGQFGLSNMKARARELGGEVDVSALPEKGTALELSIDL